MRHRWLQLRQRLASESNARGTGPARRDRGARRRRRRIRAPRGRPTRRPQAADRRERAARRRRPPPRDRSGADPRPRLHQGTPDDRREQPPGPPRPRDRDPQRDHLERRGALRATRHRARPARDDGRLRGHLRARRRARHVRRRARGARRRDGRRLDRRARAPTSLHVARGVGRPLWLARGRHEVLFASTRAALEVVEHALGTTFRKTEVEEGRLLTLVGRLARRRAPLEPRPKLPRGAGASRPSARRTRGASASSGSPR